MSCFLDFDNALTEKQIPHVVALGYCYGHNAQFEEFRVDREATIVKLVRGEEIAPFTMQETKRIYYMPSVLYNSGAGTQRGEAIRITNTVIDQINSLHPDYFATDHNEQKLAFSATVPYRVRKDQPMTIILMGEKGKSWKIWARPEAGYHPIYAMSGVFGEQLNDPRVLEGADEYIVLHSNAAYPAQRYEWFFEYDGKEIPNRFTPFVSPNGVSAKAVMEIVDREPELPEYRHEYRATDTENFGVDQYHPLLLQVNKDPGILDPANSMAFDAVEAGQELRFTIRANDPANDELVYDVRDENGNIFDKIEFNGLTGELVFQTTANDVGSYTLKAIAKDGKGGIGERVFNIIVKNAFDIVVGELVPDDTVVPRRGRLGFQVTITNNTDVVQSLGFATDLVVPWRGNSRKYPPSGFLLGPYRFRLNPGESKSANLSFYVPGYAPLGTYTYRGYVGRAVIGFHTSRFDFQVTAP
jgi:hypothetical protein